MNDSSRGVKLQAIGIRAESRLDIGHAPSYIAPKLTTHVFAEPGGFGRR